MHKGLWILSLLLWAGTLSAQSRYTMPAVWTEQGYQYVEEPSPLQRDVRAVEVELGVGFPFGVARLRENGIGRYRTGVTGFVEARYNCKRAPFDVGLQLRPTLLHRNMREDRGHASYTSVGVMATSDYNFRQSIVWSFFVGVGVGYASCSSEKTVWFDSSSGAVYDNGPSASVCVMPRAGLEFRDRLRLTVAYQFQKREYSNFSVTLGISIGGGRKDRVKNREAIIPAIIETVFDTLAR